jgi:integrase
MSERPLRVTEIGPMIRELERAAVRDRSYQQFPVGAECGRFLRALRFGGASRETLANYETVYARLALRFSDFASLEDFVGPQGREYLEEFLDREWGECAPATRRLRLQALRSLAKWAYEQGKASEPFTSGIKAPRLTGAERLAHPPAELRILVDAQETLRDRCALGLFAFLGLRKNELRTLRIGSLDLTRNYVSVHGKGDKVALLPLSPPELREDLYLHVVVEGRAPHEYLLHPKKDPSRPMVPSSVHRWFKRCLARAGLPDFPLHELRHSAGDAIWRATGNPVLAKELLRHSSLDVTMRYLHPTREDVAVGLEAVAEVWGVRSGETEKAL